MSNICRSSKIAAPWVATALVLLAVAPAFSVDYPVSIQRGNGLRNLFSRLNAGQPATIAWLGGSITQGWGYRDLTMTWFNGKYPGRVTEVNAGWGGTGSLIGAMRVERDVLTRNPHVIFVEFAVNDLPEDPRYFIERNCEGIVRQAYARNALTDVCFLETMAPYIEDDYLAGSYPNTVQAHYNVADRYGCPSVNIGWALYKRVLGGTPWTDLAPDKVHPNQAGSEVYADALIAYLESERTRSGAAANHAIPAPLTDYPVMSSVITTLASINPLPTGWTIKNNQFGTASFIESSTAGAQITVPFNAPAAAVKVVAGPDGGAVSVRYDNTGGFSPVYWGNSYFDFGHFIWAFPVAKTLSLNAAHSVTIRVDSGTIRLINLEATQTSPIGPGNDEVNLARSAVASIADSVYGAGFEAAKAIDGLLTSKWNSTNAASTHWLALDLGRTANVSTVIVKHAGAGGEFQEFNTQAFTFQSAPSLQGPWTTELTGNNPSQASITTLAFQNPKSMRYVRLHITDAGIDDYARIFEFEVWGIVPTAPVDFDNDGDVDQSDFGRFQACYTGSGNPQADPACAAARLDLDTDVDLDDFGIFQRCFSGPNRSADPNCAG